MARRHQLSGAATLACAALVLSVGCTPSNPAAAPVPSGTSAPSAAASEATGAPAATAAPTMPEAARGSGPKAAKAFVRHYIEVLNHAGPTGETAHLSDLGSRQCKACVAIEAFISQVHRDGGFIGGRGWSIRSLRHVNASDPTTFVIDAEVVVHPQHVRVDRKSAVQKFLGGRRIKSLTVQRKSAAWRVVRLEQPE